MEPQVFAIRSATYVTDEASFRDETILCTFTQGKGGIYAFLPWEGMVIHFDPECDQDVRATKNTTLQSANVAAQGKFPKFVAFVRAHMTEILEDLAASRTTRVKDWL